MSVFFWEFRVNLGWCLPRGQRKDTKVDEVFHYDKDISKPLELDRMNHDMVQYIFTTYDFSQPMPNYEGNRVEPDVEPTGFNCFLGNLERFRHDVELDLQKYSSSASPELCERVEFSLKMAKARTDGIKLDMATSSALSKQEADGIADLFMELRGDWFATEKEYGASTLPSLAGRVLKSDRFNGSIGVTWPYAKYTKGKWAAEKQ